jgi:protein CpxP
MKNLLMIAIVLFSITLTAQHKDGEGNNPRHHMGEKIKDLTPEHAAELRSKKMTLALDLNETQQKAVRDLELELAKKRKAKLENLKDRKELSSEELFKIKAEALDDKIAAKNKMKSILTQEQFEKWEKTANHKNKRRSRKAVNKTHRKNNR